MLTKDDSDESDSSDSQVAVDKAVSEAPVRDLECTMDSMESADDDDADVDDKAVDVKKSKRKAVQHLATASSSDDEESDEQARTQAKEVRSVCVSVFMFRL